MSNATLVSGEKVQLLAMVENKPFVLAQLDTTRNTQPLDLYFRVEQNVEFKLKGKGEVHLTGYYDPMAEDEESDDEDLEEGVL